MFRILSISSLRVVYALILLSFVLLNCDDNDNPESWDCPGDERPATNEEKVTIGQGIWGDIWFWQGDFMPICPSGTVSAVSRDVRIHTLTHLDDVEMVGYSAFYSDINSELVDSVWSTEDGFFEIGLDTGWYSIFVVEDSLLYANGFDGIGHIWPVHVSRDSVIGITFDITYLASH